MLITRTTKRKRDPFCPPSEFPALPPPPPPPPPSSLLACLLLLLASGCDEKSFTEKSKLFRLFLFYLGLSLPHFPVPLGHLADLAEVAIQVALQENY